MILTEASQAYAAAMAALHAAAAEPGERWGEATIRSLLAQPATTGLIADAAGFILLQCAADEAEVLMLAVVPALRRRGIGRALLEAGSRAAVARGARALFLEVDVANAGAQALYRQAGFVEVGRRRGYYASGSDAVILRRLLDGERPGGVG